jgi:hypothetical protein
MKEIFLLIFVLATKVFHLQIMCLNLFFQTIVIEMLFNNKIKIFFWNEFICVCVHVCTLLK